MRWYRCFSKFLEVFARRSRTPSPRNARARLQLEQLETREVPSVSVPGFNLDSSGTLYHSTTSGWQPIDRGVQDFSVVGNKVFDLHTDHSLYALNNDGSGKRPLDTGVESFAVTPLRVVYELNARQ